MNWVLAVWWVAIVARIEVGLYDCVGLSLLGGLLKIWLYFLFVDEGVFFPFV